MQQVDVLPPTVIH